MDMKTFLQRMPKCELHVHIEGTLEPSLLQLFHARNGLPLPQTLATTSITGYAFHDLTSFLAVHYRAMSCLLTTADFFDLAYSYLEKCAEQNVIYTEMFFDPQAHTRRGVPFATVLTGYRLAIEKASSDLNVTSKLIMCFLRDMSAASAMETLDEALTHNASDILIGVGLDSDERDNPPSKFAAVFAKARDAGLKITCHCDIDQPGSIEHIRQCIDDIVVDRIDHGTNVVESPRLVSALREKGVGLTCCPISNSIVTQDFKGKEMVQLLRAGVKVTVNSDDPAYFRGYVVENLEMLAQGTDVSRGELVGLQRNGFEIAWVGEKERRGFLERLDEFEREALG